MSKRPKGIWLEIDQIEYDSAAKSKKGAAIVARFKADQDPREPAWYHVCHIPKKRASQEYDRFLKWTEKGRVLLGRLGPVGSDLKIIAIRTKTPAAKSDG